MEKFEEALAEAKRKPGNWSGSFEDKYRVLIEDNGKEFYISCNQSFAKLFCSEKELRFFISEFENL